MEWSKHSEERYQVMVEQEIPYSSPDDDFDDCFCQSTGKVETWTAGTFPALHLAQTFADALEQKIADGSGYVVSCFTPRISILKVSRTVTKEVVE